MSSSSNVESIAEVFRCFICMEKLSDARLCPHCSKLCCYPCIRRWLNDQHQQCPHCRATLHLNDLVICRWAEEVTAKLNTLKTHELSKQKREEQDKCELHQETLTVYCSSCSKCICHQCALFNGSHKGHNFLPIDEVYNANMSIVNERLEQLKRRYIELICFMQDIENNVEKLKAVKDEKFREIRNFLHAIQTKVEEQVKTKFNTLNAQRVQLSCEVELIEQALHDIECRISTNGKAEVIGKQQDLLKSIETIFERSMTNFVPTPVSYDLPSEVTPQYTSSNFQLTNFSIFQQLGNPVYSKPLHVNGLIWRLKIYPNGNDTVHGIYLSVFLELTHGFNEPSKYEYRVEMIHQSKDSTKNFIREFTSEFETGECWGYNKYFLLNDLVSEGFLDTINNTLTVRFSIRPLTYQQQSHDQQLYIKSLSNDNHRLSEEIKILNEKIQSLMPKKHQNKEILSTAMDTDTHCTENLAETAIDTSEFNGDDDDQYTSIESNQLSSDEDENDLTENDIEKNLNSQSHSHSSYSYKTNEIPIARSTTLTTTKSHSNTTNLLPNAISNELQRTFDTRIYESVSSNAPMSSITDEDFILANILQNSANDQQHIILHSNENQLNPSFRFYTTAPHNTDESTTSSSESFTAHRFPYQSSNTPSNHHPSQK